MAADAPARGAAGEVVTKLSPWSLADTVARLSAVVAARGMKLFAVIDHSGEAAASGLELGDTKVVFFGSQETDMRVIAAEPLAALDLLLKVAVPHHRKERNFSMSHHLDTPLAAQTGQLYLDDLYVFPGEGSTVFIMDVNSNVNGLHSEPGFHPEARYEFKVHFDGAGFETLTYRVSFGEADSDGRQALQLHVLTGGQAREDSAAGDLVLEGRTGEAASAGGTLLWAGRIADSFYIDLSLLAIINGAVASGTAPDLSGWRPGNAQNSFAGTFVDSIVLEVSHQHPQLRPGARAGVWCATKLATDAGGWRQINRAGHPMMWPIFWPGDTDFSDPANTRHPSEDTGAAVKYIGEQVAAVVAAAGTSDDPEGYGQTVARDLFPDVLPYVIGTPAVYGFAARNGRTLADNAPEAMLSLVTNTAVPSGLKPSVAQDQRTSDFPYVVPA